MQNNKREQWGSKLGFILAAAGSAVGLGNIWRFSYVAGNEGGAAFLFIYLIAIALIGYPLLTTEVALGRFTQKNPVGVFKAMAPGTPWWLTGSLAVLTAFIILSFYSVISGWSLAYTYKALQGFTPETDFAGMFLTHISNLWSPILWHGLFMVITLGIIAAGVVEGIQKVSKILMPILFLLLLGLVFRGVTLEGGSAGISFYLSPDFSKVDAGTILAAVGQAFFSLSLGMGALITYGSYLSKKENLTDSSAWIAGLDTLIAVLAGLAIFPAVFALGFAPDSGPGLAFITLPAVFANMPGGTVFGFGFFLLLSIAAITSALSLLEVVVSWVIDEKGWSRKKASLIFGIIIFFIGLPSTLGYSILSDVKFLRMDILDTLDFITSSIFLPVGGILTSLFAAYVWRSKNAVEDINTPKGKIVFGNWYGILLGIFIPIAVFIVMVSGLYQKFN
jgi:NSS family neurotransmitter:Na+ symporter